MVFLYNTKDIKLQTREIHDVNNNRYKIYDLMKKR